MIFQLMYHEFIITYVHYNGMDRTHESKTKGLTHKGKHKSLAGKILRNLLSFGFKS